MIEVFAVEKIGCHKPAYALSLATCSDLIKKEFASWSVSWNDPAVIAMDGKTCVGFISYELTDDEDFIFIQFVGIDSAYRGGARVLILMLSKFRDIIKNSNRKKIKFSYHPDNISMHNAATIFNAHVESIRAVITLKDIA